MSTQSYLNSKRNRAKTYEKKKFVSVHFKCKWCGKVLQTTSNKFEKREKDFCNVYCNRPYYDFKKRITQQLEDSSLAIFSEELDEKRNEILEEMQSEDGSPGKQLNEIFMGYSKVVRSKIHKNPALRKRLEEKRDAVLKKNNSTIEDK